MIWTHKNEPNYNEDDGDGSNGNDGGSDCSQMETTMNKDTQM